MVIRRKATTTSFKEVIRKVVKEVGPLDERVHGVKSSYQKLSKLSKAVERLFVAERATPAEHLGFQPCVPKVRRENGQLSLEGGH